MNDPTVGTGAPIVPESRKQINAWPPGDRAENAITFEIASISDDPTRAPRPTEIRLVRGSPPSLPRWIGRYRPGRTIAIRCFDPIGNPILVSCLLGLLAACEVGFPPAIAATSCLGLALLSRPCR